MKNLAVSLLGLLIVACNSSSDSEVQKDITIDDWMAQNIDSYSFNYKVSGFTPRSGEEWEIYVNSGEVIHVNYIGEGTPSEDLDVELAPTIDSLFNQMSNCENIDTCEIKVQEYDITNKFPTKYTEEYISESVGFEVSSFVAQEFISLIQSNKNIWVSSGVSDYTFTYFSSMTDCPTADPYVPVEITVEDGSISSIYVPDFEIFKDIESTHYSTIEQIFENMIESSSSIQGEPIFDAAFGYPILYETDLSSAECDGQSVQISSFVASY